MLKELIYDVTTWWNEQSFSGKDWYKINDLGALSLSTHYFLKERNIAYLTIDNADVVLKNLQEKFVALEAKVKEIEAEWVATEEKLKFIDKIEHLKEWMQHINAVGDFEKIVKLVLDWELTIKNIIQDNYNEKIKLVELAETLAESENWKDVSQSFRELIEKWKQTGFIDKGRNEKLFGRIETARKKFHDRKRIYQEEEEKDMKNNLAYKIDLVDQAEELANSEDWKSTSETFIKLMETWKTIGRTPNKKNEELWLRFSAAKNNFFDRKKLHFNDVQQDQEANYLLKLPLVEKAELLKESTDWGATTQAFAAVLEEWKKIGRVPIDKATALNKNFNDACDYFYEAKKRYFDEIRQGQEANYQQKLVLLNRAEELKESIYWQEATTEMLQLKDEWKKIGAVPKEHNNSMWEAFLAAQKHFFARKDADRELRRQQYEVRNSARMEEAKAIEDDEKARILAKEEYEIAQQKNKIEEAKNKINRLQEDIKEEEAKLADFNAALLNIVPGKKAAQLKAHLENLIVETTENLKRLKNKQ